MPTRRTLIANLGVAASAALAGCPGDLAESSSAETEQQGTEQAVAGPEVAVAAQWNVYAARLYDAVALGRAGETGAGAAVAESIFAAFEGATGEYGAHEHLESTSHSAYEGFEAGLEDLQSALTDGDVEAAAEAADAAAGQLKSAQQVALGDAPRLALDLLWLGNRGADAVVLAEAGQFGAAETVATEAYERFEAELVHSALEDADHDAYEAFEHGLEDAAAAAGDRDAAAVDDAIRSALDAAVTGAYSLVDSDAPADAGHLATLQARGYDAAVLADTDGTDDGFAHAAALNVYRARAADAHWLAGQGESDLAATIAGDVYAHFEEAEAHEAIEAVDHEAYEGFEGGLEALESAAEEEDESGVADATETVDANLLAGIEALAGGDAAALESGFFRARLADALELYELGAGDDAAAVVEDLLARFESDELGFHEAMEHQSEDLYHRFEDEHVPALQTAFSEGDDEGVQTHYEDAQSALLEFEAAKSETLASGAETAYTVGRGFDAAGVAATGDAARAETIAEAAYEHFEEGAAGFHEAVEHADHETYEAFEERLEAVQSAAADGGAVYEAAKAANDEGLAGLYAVVANAGGDTGPAAAAIVEDLFATFEAARVHEALEEADHDAYEEFEHEMEAYADAVESGDADVGGFADAARTAQFAVVGATEAAPAGESGDGE